MLDKLTEFGTLSTMHNKSYAGLAQLLERFLAMEEARS